MDSGEVDLVPPTLWTAQAGTNSSLFCDARYGGSPREDHAPMQTAFQVIMGPDALDLVEQGGRLMMKTFLGQCSSPP